MSTYLIPLQERKMKCDPGQNSCANCLARNLQCYVTDRITGETYARGYMNKLREENAMLRAQLAAALNELQYCQSLLHGGLQRSEAPYGNLSYRNQDPFQVSENGMIRNSSTVVLDADATSHRCLRCLQYLLRIIIVLWIQRRLSPGRQDVRATPRLFWPLDAFVTDP